MTAEINTPAEAIQPVSFRLSPKAAEDIFNNLASAIYGRPVIFDYQIADLFGLEVASWAFRCMGLDSFLKSGTDWNSWGSCRCDYFTRSGYDKIVSHHNYLMACKEYEASEGGKIWQVMRDERHREFEAQDAEERRKYEERRERARKAAAARKAKRAAEQEAEA